MQKSESVVSTPAHLQRVPTRRSAGPERDRWNETFTYMTELHTPDITGKDRELRLDYLAALHYPAADGCPQLEKAEEKPTSFAVPWTDGPGPGGNRLHSFTHDEITTMTRDEFEQMSSREGYGEPMQVSFAPLSRSETHRHDKQSFVYVIVGEFILNTPNGALRRRPGETCMLDKDVDHAEEAGADGATILVTRK